MPVADDHAATCSECGEDRQVELPERLVEACVRHRLLLFVGSGASTESHNVMPHTFYDDIADAMPSHDESRPFPDLMEAYVEEFSRTDLILRFFDRMHYIEKFADLYRRAVRFHRAVAVIPYFREIITTNWDDYFERIAGAIPLVVGTDFDYWSLPRRKVLKLHGSSQNPGSMIATKTEYKKSLAAIRNGALGAAARHLLTTNSVAFIGYSMEDDDVRDVIKALRSDLGQAAKQVYFVHPSDSFRAPIPDATVIPTSAASFIDQLDEALVARGYLHPLKMYDRVFAMHAKANHLRQKCTDHLPEYKYPLSIFNHAYQDGVIHACQRMESDMKFGDDRAPGHLNHLVRSYDDLAKAARRDRDYWNLAYWEGYLTGLVGALAFDSSLNAVPMYYCPGPGPESSYERLARAVRGGEATHKTAYRWAKRAVERSGPEMVSTHMPFG